VSEAEITRTSVLRGPRPSGRVVSQSGTRSSLKTVRLSSQRWPFVSGPLRRKRKMDIYQSIKLDCRLLLLKEEEEEEKGRRRIKENASIYSLSFERQPLEKIPTVAVGYRGKKEIGPRPRVCSERKTIYRLTALSKR
jgi:hypothetical protein